MWKAASAIQVCLVPPFPLCISLPPRAVSFPFCSPDHEEHARFVTVLLLPLYQENQGGSKSSCGSTSSMFPAPPFPPLFYFSFPSGGKENSITAGEPTEESMRLCGYEAVPRYALLPTPRVAAHAMHCCPRHALHPTPRTAAHARRYCSVIVAV